MTELFAWCGFLGAWLLVAGPVFQAAVELDEQEIRRESIEAARGAVEPLPPVSPWWWLLPPVAWWKIHRRADEMQNAALAALSPEDREAIVDYMDKASGWLFVGLGGFFIASKETWELVEINEWPHGLTFVIIPVLGLLAVANTAYRQRRTHTVLGKPVSRRSRSRRRARPGGGAGGR